MGIRDPRIDAYIAKSAPFAQPLLAHLRDIVHEACPDVTETLKWSMPAFMHEGILCMMAAFKAHCTFGFWKGAMIVDSSGDPAKAAMGQFGRITQLRDLPPKKILAGYVRQAAKLNEQGVNPVRRTKPKTVLSLPDDLAAALKRNRAARKTYDAFSRSKQQEYVEWVTEAKTETTRRRRLDTAIEWLAEGKSRHWKYQKC